jgi:hypothetical protein
MTDKATVEVLVDEAFMKNVREARENGYDRLCAECGCGIYDVSDFHDRACSEYEEFTR